MGLTSSSMPSIRKRRRSSWTGTYGRLLMKRRIWARVQDEVRWTIGAFVSPASCCELVSEASGAGVLGTRIGVLALGGRRESAPRGNELLRLRPPLGEKPVPEWGVAFPGTTVGDGRPTTVSASWSGEPTSAALALGTAAAPATATGPPAPLPRPRPRRRGLMTWSAQRGGQ